MSHIVEQRLERARPSAEPAEPITREARARAVAALPRRRFFRPVWLAAPGLALAAIAAVAIVSRLGSDAGVASAAELRATVSEALASSPGLRGVLVVDESEGKPDERRWSFWLGPTGDFRLSGEEESYAYDAAANLSYSERGERLLVAAGRPAGWPDGIRPDWALQRGLGAAVAALAGAADGEVQEVEHAGRPGWLLRVRGSSQTPTGAVELTREVIVDRELGLPVRDVMTRDGEIVGQWRLEGLSEGGDFPKSLFRLEPGAGQNVARVDEGFRDVTMAEAREAAGYDPLAPAWLPAAYELARVSFSGEPQGWDDKPAPRRIVSLLYRRGLEELVVTNRPAAESPVVGSGSRFLAFCSVRSISVLICANTQAAVNRESVELAGGALAGTTAQVGVDFSAVPHVVATGETLTVTIAGAADRGELVRMANSLAAR